VPKKTKVVQTESGTVADSASSTPDTKIEKVRPRRTSTKTGKPAPNKGTTTRAVRSKAAPLLVTEPTDEDIRLRAYLISERRRRFDLPGDASSDWLEAKRQLLSESGRR